MPSTNSTLPDPARWILPDPARPLLRDLQKQLTNLRLILDNGLAESVRQENTSLPNEWHHVVFYYESTLREINDEITHLQSVLNGSENLDPGSLRRITRGLKDWAAREDERVGDHLENIHACSTHGLTTNKARIAALNAVTRMSWNGALAVETETAVGTRLRDPQNKDHAAMKAYVEKIKAEHGR